MIPTVSLRSRVRAMQAAGMPVLVWGLHTSALTKKDVATISRCYCQMMAKCVVCARAVDEEWYQ